MKHRLQMDLSPPGCVETTISTLHRIAGNTPAVETGFRHSKQTQIHFRSVFHEVPGLDQD